MRCSMRRESTAAMFGYQHHFRTFATTMACPHDFYLRKVLGFAPTIDQAFGYGRGVHSLMRAIHSNPKKWAALASNPPELDREIQSLVDRGLFYLRYTTGVEGQSGCCRIYSEVSV